MWRRMILVGAVLAAAVAVVVTRSPAGTAHTASRTAHTRSRTARSPSRSPRAAAPPRRARATALPRLSLAQLAGQRIVYAYAGLQPPASLLAAIRAGEAGGVIFFAPNISSPRQIRSVVDRMQRLSLAGPAHARLLMLTDQEGGEVRRLPGEPLLSEKQIGASRDGVALARAAGAGAAATLNAAGINANLAPVLDVYRRPGNFIDQFQRSYSQDPARAASLGAAFIAAQQARGVAATAKHFPGLGGAAATANTDLRPVRLNIPLTTMRAVDEAPYRSAIAAGVKLVMVSWAVYPALDPLRPAGLSPAVIGGELRKRLHFAGVTITDGIDAGAVTPYGSLGRRSVRAVAAGADLILCAATNPADNTPAQGLTALHALVAAMRAHRLSIAAARRTAARILALRARP